MQFVILKDDYEVDEYGIEIKQEELPKRSCFCNKNVLLWELNDCTGLAER